MLEYKCQLYISLKLNKNYTHEESFDLLTLLYISLKLNKNNTDFDENILDFTALHFS